MASVTTTVEPIRAAKSVTPGYFSPEAVKRASTSSTVNWRPP